MGARRELRRSSHHPQILETPSRTRTRTPQAYVASRRGQCGIAPHDSTDLVYLDTVQPIRQIYIHYDTVSCVSTLSTCIPTILLHISPIPWEKRGSHTS